MSLHCWNCSWCGNQISENIIIVSKNRHPICNCIHCKYEKRTTCSFRCMMDMKNFKQRMFGDKKLKSVATPCNSALKSLLVVVPYLLIERRPMKPIANHLTALIKIKKENLVEPIIKIQKRKHVGIIKMVIKN